jgi:signal transduction histidine kinase
MSGKILEQEAERKKFSRERRDEIAQTLPGINVRRLTLKRAATSGWAMPKKEVVNTRRLVQESAQSIKQFASEFDSRRQA